MSTETLDILGDGGILKTIIKQGYSDEQPQSEDKVEVHYTGKKILTQIKELYLTEQNLILQETEMKHLLLILTKCKSLEDG
jgi:hypothetical protein